VASPNLIRNRRIPGDYPARPQLPDLPITGYLTRSLSLMYAMHGAIVLLLSSDVRRFLPVVKVLAVLTILLG
jgi:hypothetical protein